MANNSTSAENEIQRLHGMQVRQLRDYAIFFIGLDGRTEAGATATHEPLPTVVAVHSQIVRVFQNLLSNAIKFGQLSETRPFIFPREKRANIGSFQSKITALDLTNSTRNISLLRLRDCTALNIRGPPLASRSAAEL